MGVIYKLTTTPISVPFEIKIEAYTYYQPKNSFKLEVFPINEEGSINHLFTQEDIFQNPEKPNIIYTNDVFCTYCFDDDTISAQKMLLLTYKKHLNELINFVSARYKELNLTG